MGIRSNARFKAVLINVLATPLQNELDRCEVAVCPAACRALPKRRCQAGLPRALRWGASALGRLGSTGDRLQTHDALDCSVASPELAERVAQLGREAVTLELPMQVDLKFGRNWGDAKHSWDEGIERASPGPRLEYSRVLPGKDGQLGVIKSSAFNSGEAGWRAELWVADLRA